MSARILLGGFAVLVAVGWWHRPTAHDRLAADDRRSTCGRVGMGDVCTAVAGLSTSLRAPILRLNGVHVFPPPGTPGAVDPAITQANIDSTICRPGYSRSARPAYAIMGPLKRRMMDAEHPGEPLADYELDHLIPISLGGAPLDPRDLWLQPRQGPANANDKNALSYILWRLVCEHRLSLETVQRAISRDWTKAYDTYATPENLARYRFRDHPEDDG